MEVNIMTLNDIRQINWHGNAYHDEPNFRIVDQFILKSKNRDEQKEAIRIMSEKGMGIIQNIITEVELDEYLEMAKQAQQ